MTRLIIVTDYVMHVYNVIDYHYIRNKNAVQLIDEDKNVINILGVKEIIVKKGDIN